MHMIQLVMLKIATSGIINKNHRYLLIIIGYDMGILSALYLPEEIYENTQLTTQSIFYIKLEFSH